MKIARKIKAHVISLPRWFAAPFFGSSVLLGAVMAGGINMDAWLALAAGLLLMAYGHSMNSFLDYAWTGLDKGEKEDRSAEKAYTGGQNLIENGVVSIWEVLVNAFCYAGLSEKVLWHISDAINKWPLWVIFTCSLGIPWMYSWGKFTVWAHELSLGLAVGPTAVMLGMFAVNPDPPIVDGLLVGVPVAIILSFLGLALDEWPDAKQNLEKGVKSLAYKVWEYSRYAQYTMGTDGSRWEKGFDLLRWYCTAWMMFLCVYHVLLIALGVLAPLTGLALIVIPVIIGLMVMMERDFRQFMVILIAVASLYPVLILVGQIFG